MNTTNRDTIIDDNTTPQQILTDNNEQITDTGDKNTNTLRDTLKEQPRRINRNELRPLTRKQQAFVKHLIENPKDSATQAVKNTYNVSTQRSAEVIASENLSKPEIQIALYESSELAQETVIDVMNYSRKLGKSGTKEGASYASVALSGARDILDRVHGKARQQVEVQSTSVSININLASD